MSSEIGHRSAPYTERIVEEVSEWEHVEIAPHRFNAVEFNLDAYEIGHVHRPGTLDINYPKRLRDALVDEGKTGAHHFVPKSGWTTFRIDSPADTEHGIWLLRLSYLYRVLTQRKKPVGEQILANIDLETELTEMGVSDAVRRVFENVTKLEGR